MVLNYFYCHAFKCCVICEGGEGGLVYFDCISYLLDYILSSDSHEYERGEETMGMSRHSRQFDTFPPIMLR